MIQICLYNNYSDINVVNKNIQNCTVFEGVFKTPINILSPIVIIEGNNLFNFNYAYIETFHRYYFMENINIIKNNLFEINLRVDVLKTYAQDIKNSYGYIKTQENYNPYLGEFEIDNRMEIEQKNFNNPFNNEGNIILVSVRG